jgi:hypothetical protein
MRRIEEGTKNKEEEEEERGKRKRDRKERKGGWKGEMRKEEK